VTLRGEFHATASSSFNLHQIQRPDRRGLFYARLCYLHELPCLPAPANISKTATGGNMSNGSTRVEQAAFGERLAASLRDAGFLQTRYAELASEFNVRSRTRPIAVATARKWALGEAIPCQERVQVLAQWLAVNPEWLRFGQTREVVPNVNAHAGNELQSLAADVARLSAEDREMVRELVVLLANTSRSAALKKGLAKEG
jgi:hypothetical protein